MKKRAFTMVELIFVIVILGILAAVAVPRLNASRDDAEITKFAANLATIYKDVQTYYLANGTTFTDETAIAGYSAAANIAKVTNVPLQNGDGAYKSLQIGGANCLELALVKNEQTGEFIRIRRTTAMDDANPMCVKMWEVFASKPELEELVKGQNSETDERIFSLTGYRTYFSRPIIKYKDGVQFD